MESGFINNNLLLVGPWQALERSVCRLMLHKNFQDVRLVGQTGDCGADILAKDNFGHRYVVQVKFRNSGPVGKEVVDEVLKARSLYKAEIPVIATNSLVTEDVYKRQRDLANSGILLQIWDKNKLLKMFQSLDLFSNKSKEPREYQKQPIEKTVERFTQKSENKGLIIMATGLGKTFVAAQSVKKIIENPLSNIRHVLVLAHTNELVYQLEKAFWPCLPKTAKSSIWNGIEKGDIENSLITFGCINSVALELERSGELPVNYDLIVIDEAHHAGSSLYQNLIQKLKAGNSGGPFLLGLTATPWRSDEVEIGEIFGDTICSIDIVKGMGEGYLANVDYRMFTDNIDWDSINDLHNLTPKGLNKKFFISEWDEGVINQLQKVWAETPDPHAIVFCSNIEHAHLIKDKINSRKFTRAGVIYSGLFNGKRMGPVDRALALIDFADRKLGVICAVDIFNEGIDVPDVNILVFQRVTHSRRIFVQQLGRGLRISQGKDKVIVLDFVSDIRRFAAGLDLKAKLSGSKQYISLGNPIKFINHNEENIKVELFLKTWLDDVAAIQNAGDDDHILKFPPNPIDFGI